MKIQILQKRLKPGRPNTEYCWSFHRESAKAELAELFLSCQLAALCKQTQYPPIQENNLQSS